MDSCAMRLDKAQIFDGTDNTMEEVIGKIARVTRVWPLSTATLIYQAKSAKKWAIMMILPTDATAESQKKVTK